MKKQFLILVLALLLINSCSTNDLLLSNGNAISTSNFPATRAELESALNGTYSPLQSQGLYGRYLTYMYDYMAGDEAFVGPTRGTPDLRDFLEYTFTADNNDIYLYWKNAYNGISRCNFILDKTDKINALSNAEVPQADKDDFIGQAKFLRAFYYFLLVERFGDIPLYTTTNVDPSGLGKSPKADVYALIINDLQDASTKLKVKSVAEAGRATKGAADALLGKVYLYQGDFTNAKTSFAKVITSGEYTLTANYFDNFSNVNENNSESVFEVQFAYSGGGAWAYADWGGQDNGDSETSFRSIEYGGLGGFHNNDPSHSLVNEYEVGDSRKNDNFYFAGDTWSGGVVGAINPAAAPAYWRKYQKSFNQGTDGGGLSDINHRVIRYADVLLMMAEAENETGGQAAAVGYLNQVRNRVSMPNYGTAAMNATYPVTTQAEVFAAIVHERRVELAGEQVRFPDLLRWGMANTIPGFVVGKHELFPIPQKEFDTNSNLSTADQNPGY